MWIPMLDGDDEPSAVEASQAFSDRPILQFWDGDKKLGHEIARSVNAENWTAWDIYLFYRPGAEWTDKGLPAPAAMLAQAGGVVVGTRGTLPSGDPSQLPERLRERLGNGIDVVGEQSDLEALLSRVAAGFAKRYP